MDNSILQTFKDSIATVTDADALVKALQTDPQTSIRINPLKTSSLNFNKIPWAEHGYYLDKRPLFTLDPLFHAGAYYVQEASSMFIHQIIKPFATKPLRVLDLCAAPGGKTTLTQSLLPTGSIIVANEVIRNRSQILSENCIKWGLPNCVVTNNDPKDFHSLQGFFDLILVDAPCSGEGMFRKDNNASQEWSLENVNLCSKRQLRILYDIWDCLSPNGMLIYSTCTFNERENEDVVSQFITDNNACCQKIPLQEEWNVTERIKNNAISYRFFPHKTQGEGFSVSVIRKVEGKEYASKRTKKGNGLAILPQKNAILYKDLIKNPSDYIIFNDKKNISWAFPQNQKEALSEIANNCNIVHAGIPLAESIGQKLNPHPGLAFSVEYANTAFPSFSVDLETALRYFKKESLQIPNAAKGWINLTFKNYSLGFVKNIGNRANNPYPQEWAIRMNIDYNNLPLPLL